MSSRLACVGLPVDDLEALDRLVDRMLERSRPIGRPGSVETSLWIDTSGAQVTIVLYEVRGRPQVLDVVTSFAGRGTADLGQLAAHGTFASASVRQDGEEVTQLLVELPQAPYLPRIPVDFTPALMTAHGLDVEVFVSDEAFAASPRSSLGVEVDGETVRYAPESFTSHGLFGAATDADPIAFLAGRVQAAETRTNSLTGQPFQAALVRTVGFEATVCLAVDEHPEPPPSGSIVAGSVWMVADVPTLWKVQPKPTRAWLRERLAGLDQP